MLSLIEHLVSWTISVGCGFRFQYQIFRAETQARASPFRLTETAIANDSNRRFIRARFPFWSLRPLVSEWRLSPNEYGLLICFPLWNFQFKSGTFAMTSPNMCIVACAVHHQRRQRHRSNGACNECICSIRERSMFHWTNRWCAITSVRLSCARTENRIFIVWKFSFEIQRKHFPFKSLLMRFLFHVIFVASNRWCFNGKAHACLHSMASVDDRGSTRLLTCSARGIFGVLLEIVPGHEACSDRLNSDRLPWIHRVEYVAWCASLRMKWQK